MPNFLMSAAIVTQNLREGKTMKACGHNNLGEREQLSCLITTLSTMNGPQIYLCSLRVTNKRSYSPVHLCTNGKCCQEQTDPLFGPPLLSGDTWVM